MASKKITVEVNVVENGKLKKITLEGEKAKAALSKLERGAGATDRAMKGVAGATSNSTKAFAKQSQGLGGLVHAYATVAANAFALTAAFMALQKAADLKVLKSSMEIMDKASGTNLAGMAKALKEVTGGMITFEESAKQAAIVSAAGFGRSELVALGKAARGASQALGRDFGDSMDRLVRGVVKAEPELLDELGIILRLDDASKKYAKTLGKNVNELTTYEKQVAVMNEVLDQSNDKYGDIIESSATVNQFTRLQAEATELLHTALGGLASVLSPLAGYLSDNSAALGTLMAVTALALGKMAIPMFASLGTAIESWGTKAEDNFERQLVKHTDLVNSYRDTSSAAHKFARDQGDALKRTLSTYKNITPKIRKLIQDDVSGEEFTKQSAVAINQSIAKAKASLALDSSAPISGGLLKGGSEKDLRNLIAQQKSAMAAVAAIHSEAANKVQAAWSGKFSLINIHAKRASLEIAGAGVAAVAGWKAAGSVSLFDGFIDSFKNIERTFEGVGATASGAGVSINGFTKSAARATLSVRVLGSALLTALNVIGLIFLGFQALSFAWDFFKSDDAKAQEKSLKEIDEGLEGVTESANKFKDTIRKAGEMTVSSMADAIKQADLLKNAYTQLADTASGEFAKVDKIVSANMRRIEMAERAKKLAEADLLQATTNRIPDNVSATVLDRNSSNYQQLSAAHGVENATNALAAAEEKSKVLRQGLKGIHKFILENPLEIDMIIADLPEGEIKKNLKAFQDAKFTAPDIDTDAYKSLATAVVGGLKAAQVEATSLYTSLQEITKAGSDIPKAIHTLLVPAPDSYAKMGNDIAEAGKNLIEVSKNSKAGKEQQEQAALSMKKVLESLGYTTIETYDIMMSGGPAKAAFMAANAWGVMKQGLEAAEGNLGKFNSGLLSTYGILSKVATAEFKLQALRKNAKSGKAEDIDALKSAELNLVNEKIKAEERSASQRIASLEKTKSLKLTEEERLQVDQQILNIQKESNSVILGLVENSENLIGGDREGLQIVKDRVAEEERVKQILQTRAVVEQKYRAHLKEQGRLDEEATQRLIEKHRLQTESLAFSTALSALSTQEEGQAARSAVLNRQALQMDALLLAQTQKRAKVLAEISRLTAALAAVPDNTENSSDRKAAIQAQLDALNIEQAGMGRTDDNAKKLMSLEQRKELLNFPETLSQGWDSAIRSMSASTQSLGELLKTSLTDGVKSLGDGFVDLIAAGNLTAQSFKRMALSIVADLTKMIAKQLIFNAISGALGMIGGPRPSTTPLGSFSMANISNADDAFARGGIMTPRGKAYSSGGIADRPQLALFGEGSMNEAFVPLPDGKTIPVTMNGAGSGGGTNNVSIAVNVASDGSSKTESSSDGQEARQLGLLVSQAVQRELITQQRPGGLLARG